MTRLTVHEYAAALRHRYRAARKGGKGEILDEFCQTTGMHRKAAIRLLGKRTRPRLVGRGRPRRYGPEVAQALVKLWEVGDLVGPMPCIHPWCGPPFAAQPKLARPGPSRRYCLASTAAALTPPLTPGRCWRRRYSTSPSLRARVLASVREAALIFLRMFPTCL